MNQHLKIINPDRLIKELEEVNCGMKRFAEISSEDFEIKAYQINPPEGYKLQEKFPYCCEYHQFVYESTKSWFEEFPNCCVHHAKLLKTTWFEKSEFQNIARKVVDQLSYTEYVISQKFDNSDWYEDITDYIEYNYSSFGQLPAGYGSAPGLKEYLGSLKHNLQSTTDKKLKYSPDKINRLLQFVSNYYNLKGKEKIDLNQLDNIYKNWLRIFPFGISYFKEIKKLFEEQLPILTGSSSINRYTGRSKIKVKTQMDLIEWLNKTTKTLLESINSVDLVKNNLITNSQKHTIELINENHRIKQDSILIDFKKGEMEYVRVLKKWINNEKTYFKELNSVIRVEQNYTPKLQYPPVNEDVFEDLIRDLFNELYPQSHYERFGKRGNNQKGIDILSVKRKEAIQCKKKDLSRSVSKIKSELRREFTSDILKAMSLEADIRLLIFTSTFENNAGLEDYLQKLKKKHRPKFDVMYMGWNTLSSHIHQFPFLIKKYFPNVPG